MYELKKTIYLLHRLELLVKRHEILKSKNWYSTKK